MTYIAVYIGYDGQRSWSNEPQKILSSTSFPDDRHRADLRVDGCQLCTTWLDWLPEETWITGILLVFIFMWKSLHDLRPCSWSLRSHLSQLGSLRDTQVHLMQSDRSPPTPRPLGANPRNARPHNITLAITKNGTRFDGLTLLQSEILPQTLTCLPVIIHYPQPTCKLKASSTFNRSRSNFIKSKSKKIHFYLNKTETFWGRT